MDGAVGVNDADQECYLSVQLSGAAIQYCSRDVAVKAI